MLLDFSQMSMYRYLNWRSLTYFTREYLKLSGHEKCSYLIGQIRWVVKWQRNVIGQQKLCMTETVSKLIDIIGSRSLEVTWGQKRARKFSVEKLERKKNQFQRSFLVKWASTTAGLTLDIIRLISRLWSNLSERFCSFRDLFCYISFAWDHFGHFSGDHLLWPWHDRGHMIAHGLDLSILRTITSLNLSIIGISIAKMGHYDWSTRRNSSISDPSSWRGLSRISSV